MLGFVLHSHHLYAYVKRVGEYDAEELKGTRINILLHSKL